MTLKLLEAAVKAFCSYLQDNLAARLDALDAEYADDLTLEDIKKWYVGALPPAVPEYPSVCVAGVSWELVQRMATTVIVRNSVNIFVFVGDDDQERRFRKLCRYARAVVELAEAGEATYGYLSKLPGAIELSVGIKSEPALQAVIVPVTLQGTEKY